MVNLKSLPTDGSQLNPRDIDILQQIFKNDNLKSKVKSEFKDVLIATAIFIVLSLKMISHTIKKFIPVAENQLVLIFIKSMLFFAIYYTVRKFAGV